MNRFRKPGPAMSTCSTALAEPLAERLAEPLGDRARGLAERRRKQHRGVGRVVAEVGPRRAVELGRVQRPVAAQPAAASVTAPRSSETGSLTALRDRHQ